MIPEQESQVKTGLPIQLPVRIYCIYSVHGATGKKTHSRFACYCVCVCVIARH